jgi:hypothetical protein
LQATPYDEQAALIIRAKVDTVMEWLMELFGYKKGWDEEALPAIDRVWSPPSGS